MRLIERGWYCSRRDDVFFLFFALNRIPLVVPVVHQGGGHKLIAVGGARVKMETQVENKHT